MSLTPSDRPAGRSRISWLRIALLVVGVLVLLPLTIAFGLYGCLGTLFFLLLTAFAQ